MKHKGHRFNSQKMLFIKAFAKFINVKEYKFMIKCFNITFTYSKKKTVESVLIKNQPIDFESTNVAALKNAWSPSIQMWL